MPNLPVYYMLLFKMPCKVVHLLKKAQRDFLWEGGRGEKDHLVKWFEVCKTQEGGLEIGHQREQNMALLGKWLWRFSMERDNLWHSIILVRYGLRQNGWDCSTTITPSMSLILKQIFHIAPLFFSRLRFSWDFLLDILHRFGFGVKWWN